MNRREKILALVATCVLLGWLGLPQFHVIFLAPIEDKQIELDSVNEQLAVTTEALSDIQNATLVMKQWRGRSLPPNPLDAQRHYQDWLTDLAQLVGFEELKVTPARIVPQGSAYTGVQVLLEGKARMTHVGELLYHFYRIDLPQRIVSMNIDCPEAEGDPMLSVSLTAEGLSIRGTPGREYLFPTASLKEGFTSSASAQEIEVDDEGEFPPGVPLRIRIGNEYLTVLERNENRWTVEGGRDATSPAAHAAGDTVELAPVWPEYADFTLEDFRALVGSSPFVKPPPAEPPKGKEEVVRGDDAVKDTYLAASILSGGEPTAWLYRRSKSERTVIREQSELNVGELHAVVLDIQPDFVVIRHNDTSWRLGMGDSLSTMQKLPAKAAADKPAAAEPADDKPADDRAATDEPADEMSSDDASPDEDPAAAELSADKPVDDAAASGEGDAATLVAAPAGEDS